MSGYGRAVDDDPAEIQRRLQGNQPAPAVLIVDAVAGGGDPVDVAARVLAALQQHYELRPR
jgi:hypothetical protein